MFFGSVLKHDSLAVLLVIINWINLLLFVAINSSSVLGFFFFCFFLLLVVLLFHFPGNWEFTRYNIYNVAVSSMACWSVWLDSSNLLISCWIGKTNGCSLHQQTNLLLTTCHYCCWNFYMISKFYFNFYSSDSCYVFGPRWWIVVNCNR